MTDVLSSHPPLPRSWCGGVVLGVKRFGVHVLVLVPFFHVWGPCAGVGLLVHVLVSSHALACSARTCIITRTCMQRTHALACSALACSASHLHAAHALACSTYACNSTCTRTYACHRLQHTRTQHTHTHICDVPYICSRVSSRVSRFVLCVSDALCFDAVRGP